jgi:hypothetical protein
MRVTVYLKTPLFAVGHVPEGASVLEGKLLDQAKGAYELEVVSYRDGEGRPLEGAGLKLLVPGGKVDHIVLEG